MRASGPTGTPRGASGRPERHSRAAVSQAAGRLREARIVDHGAPLRVPRTDSGLPLSLVRT